MFSSHKTRKKIIVDNLNKEPYSLTIKNACCKSKKHSHTIYPQDKTSVPQNLQIRKAHFHKACTYSQLELKNEGRGRDGPERRKQTEH